MRAQEDHEPTSGQPTQAQGDAEPGRDASRKPGARSADPATAKAASGSSPTTTRGECGAGEAAAVDTGAGDAGADDTRSDEALVEDGLSDAARGEHRPRRRDDGRYVRASHPYRGLDLSLQDFRAELSAIADDVGYLLRNESVVNPELKAQLEQRFDRLRGTVSLMAGDAREAGDRLRAEVQDRVEHRIRASRGAVQERPITSVAMAAIVGLSVGLLLSRRR